MSGTIRDILVYNIESLTMPPGKSIDSIHQDMMRALLKGDNVVFLHFPGVDAPKWPEHIKKEFHKHILRQEECPRPELDYIYFDVRGTTFSGLSTKTTLGNTLRSILYVYYYLVDSGISPEPWNDKRIFVIASGDDVAIWTRPELAERVE